jgi:hypothetical protein
MPTAVELTLRNCAVREVRQPVLVNIDVQLWLDDDEDVSPSAFNLDVYINEAPPTISLAVETMSSTMLGSMWQCSQNINTSVASASLRIG